jgi:4-alpha-glucanotransferase
MKYKRSSGIILHPTSLPGPDGIGDLGPEAYRWIEFLAGAECGLWQVLPLGPTGYGDSPYQCFSAFAGNPFLVSPALLMQDGLLKREDFASRPSFSDDEVDYGQVIPWKLALLDRAAGRFEKTADADLKKEFAAFQREQSDWLQDFALFMAIKESQGGVAWNQWPEPFRRRDKMAIDLFIQKNQPDIQRHILRQFFFFRQWQSLREYAHQQGIQIIGDIPIFVAYDSADAWGNKDLFYLDDTGQPSVVAGVPPDYFSPTGQLWGNPLYRWDVHRASGYSWWIKRIKATLKLFDIIRLDHFRGFAGYFEIPFGLPTAEIGTWIRGPGKDIFEKIQQAMGDLPIIAEDLGEITSDVIDLRDHFGLPGMKILQFAFASDATEPFLPHNYPVNCVAYTGTHDNDTTRGWYESAPEEEQDYCRRYLARSGEDIAWDMIRAVWSSIALFTLAPMQDFLSLDTKARMNMPGRLGGNWSWRMQADALTARLQTRIKEQNTLYRRSVGPEVTLPPKEPTY